VKTVRKAVDDSQFVTHSYVWGTRRLLMSALKLNENGDYGFQLESLNGFIHTRGDYHGLILLANGAPITRSGMYAINLERYLSHGNRYGHLVPGDELHYEIDRDSLSINFEERDPWKVHTTLTYCFQADDCIDVILNFIFSRHYQGFEAFVSSYFDERHLPFLNIGQEWIQPHFQPKEQLFFTRDDEASVLMVDGRWDWLQDHGHFVNDDGRKYTLPVIVTWNEKTKFALIQMIELTRCAAISINTIAHGQAFSLIGEDVRAGERITARARLLYREVTNLDVVTEWYEAWDTER
jgi:hypothetical protein